MTAHHFFLEAGGIEGGTVTLEGAEAHHAARVLRVRVGEPITVADGTGRVVSAIVTEIGDTDVVEAEVMDEWRDDPLRPALTLFQALTKGDKIDDVVDKATEVGVQRIVPFIAERTVVRWDERKLGRAHERWTGIAKAAAKKSRAPRVPGVDVVAVGPLGVLGEAGMKVVLHEGARRRLREVLPADAPDAIALVVGPEGGLSEREVGELERGGAEIVSLGPRVLRSETAGPVAAAVVAYHYGCFA